MAESNRIAILIAVIGVMGTLGAALIGNWDKIFPPSASPSSRGEATENLRVAPQRSPESVPNIAGLWRDANAPGNGSQITQAGNAFSFTRWGILANGTPFQSQGRGTIAGERVSSTYNARYQSGENSYGNCTGILSANAARIDMTCQDSLFGEFPLVAIRQ